MPLHQPLLLDLADRVQKLLRPADRKGRDDHAAAPVKGALQNFGKLCHGISGFFVQAVSVGGFDHEIIGLVYCQWVAEQRLIRIADVAAEYDLSGFPVFRQPQLHAGRAQQMADVGKAELHTFCHTDPLCIAAGTHQMQHAGSVLGRIDRFNGRATGTRRFSVDPFRIGHLDVGRIHQHDPAEVFRCLRRIDLAPEAVLIQFGQHTGVIDMRVCQKNCVDLSGQNRERRIFKNIDTLLHAAVDQIVPSTALQKRTASRHFMCRTNECKFHGHAPSLLFRSDVFYNIPLRLLCGHRAICCGSQNPPE